MYSTDSPGHASRRSMPSGAVNGHGDMAGTKPEQEREREREKYNLFDFVFMMIYLIDINTPTVPRADRLATCILFSFLSFSFSVLFFSFVLALQCPVLSR